MADETVAVTDHHADLVAVVKEQTEKGKQALAALKRHSNAGAVGSTVHAAIDGFGKVFEKLNEALEIHRKATIPAAAPPPSGPVTHPDGSATDAVPADATTTHETALEATDAEQAAQE